MLIEAKKPFDSIQKYNNLQNNKNHWLQPHINPINKELNTELDALSPANLRDLDSNQDSGLQRPESYH